VTRGSLAYTVSSPGATCGADSRHAAPSAHRVASRRPLQRRRDPAARSSARCSSGSSVPSGAAVLAGAEALPRHSAVLCAAFEWAAHAALRRRDAHAPTANVAQFLAAHLGDEFLFPAAATSGIYSSDGSAWRPPAGPGALLLPLCAGVAPPGDVGAAAVRLLRRRVAWRGRALRQLRCAATWRGAPTSLSTANLSHAAMELPTALALSDAAFAAALGALTGDSAAAARECAAAARDDAADTAPRAPGEDDSLP